ncbi:MAG: FAD-dependent oxidoreductase, partial [Chloroflexi bacterium]|nr:FAD-dependent oxidoreductase [Chloroflexota bacterium]
MDLRRHRPIRAARARDRRGVRHDDGRRHGLRDRAARAAAHPRRAARPAAAVASSHCRRHDPARAGRSGRGQQARPPRTPRRRVPGDLPIVRAVVIGAGVGGLAAAHELAKQGHEVHLVEASPVLGGQVRTFEVGGGRIENFYHHLFRSDTVVAGLIEELGLGDDLEWIESRVGMLVGDRVFRFTGALDLLRFTPVSLLTRMRLGLSALWLRRVADWERYEGMRAAEWITRAAGREGYERVWGPLLRAKFGRHAPDIAMPWFWSKIYLRFASREGGPLAKEQLGYLRGSFGRMV